MKIHEIDFNALPIGTIITFENGSQYLKLENGDGFESKTYVLNTGKDLNKTTGYYEIEKSYIKLIDVPTAFNRIYSGTREGNIKAEIEQLKQKIKEMEEKLDGQTLCNNQQR